MSFTLYLIEKKEYYRAYVELLRLKAYYPAYASGQSLYVSELYLLFQGNRFPELLKKRTEEKGMVRQADRLFKADAYLSTADYQAASSLLSSARGERDRPDIDHYSFKRLFLAEILLRRIGEAGSLVEDRKAGAGKDFAAGKYAELLEYSRNRLGDLRDTRLALAAGVIPGMGYAYSGQTSTGILALIAVSVFSTLTYFSFKTGNRPLGVLAGAATTFFYGGSILGGYLGVRKNNEQVMTGLRDHLAEDLDLGSDRERLFRELGIPGLKGR